MWNWIKKLFRRRSDDTQVTKTPPAPPVQEVPTKEEVDNFPTKKMKIAIARGHGGNDSGAKGNGTTEVEYNTWVMRGLEKAGLNISCHYGSSSVESMLSAMATNPDLIIQMHLNDADTPTANGCEVLVVDGDKESYVFAEEFAANLNKDFNKKIRRPATKGKKILDESDRGVKSLRISKFCPKILVEPFFIGNISDFIPKEEYLKFLIKQLRQWGA
jgi:N-acetylmuramoyl-L-alanine amidase